MLFFNLEFMKINFKSLKRIVKLLLLNKLLQKMIIYLIQNGAKKCFPRIQAKELF